MPPLPHPPSEAKVARGTLPSIGGQSVTVKVGDQDMTFAVDSKTLVEARGGSTKTGAGRRRRGTVRPQLDEVHRGRVSRSPSPITDMAGAFTRPASRRFPNRLLRPRAPRRTTLAKESDGVVKAMGADWITINGRGGGGASFEQTFKISRHDDSVREGRGHGGGRQGRQDAVRRPGSPAATTSASRITSRATRSSRRMST